MINSLVILGGCTHGALPHYQCTTVTPANWVGGSMEKVILMKPA